MPGTRKPQNTDKAVRLVPLAQPLVACTCSGGPATLHSLKKEVAGGPRVCPGLVLSASRTEKRVCTWGHIEWSETAGFLCGGPKPAEERRRARPTRGIQLRLVHHMRMETPGGEYPRRALLLRRIDLERPGLPKWPLQQAIPLAVPRPPLAIPPPAVVREGVHCSNAINECALPLRQQAE